MTRRGKTSDRLIRNAWWNWMWFLLGVAACGVFAWHVEYSNRWVQYAMYVILLSWVVPCKTPRLRPYPRCVRCHRKIMPGDSSVARLRGPEGAVRWRMCMNCWNAETGTVRNDDQETALP